MRGESGTTTLCWPAERGCRVAGQLLLAQVLCVVPGQAVGLGQGEVLGDDAPGDDAPRDLQGGSDLRVRERLPLDILDHA
jgi:hypothetical protein